MVLNDIVFVKGVGGLGRPLAGEDHISGLIFYTAVPPAGLSTDNPVRKMASPADADAIGVKGDYADETRATGIVTVTAVGGVGDTVSVSVKESGRVVQLGTYIRVAADGTLAAVAAGIAAVINGGAQQHGYTAVVEAASVSIRARKGLGVALNGGEKLTVATAGTLAVTVAQFAGGVASVRAVWRYHIEEFFRVQPQGILYVGFYPVPAGAYTFSEVVKLQNVAGGKIRQVGVYKDAQPLLVSDVTSLDGVCKQLDAVHKNLSALLAADISGVEDLADLPDLSTLPANKVSVVISQDGGAMGAGLFAAYGRSITNLGALLGTVAKAKVSESIAWVGKYNLSDGIENDTLAFANGQPYTAIDENKLSLVNSCRYIFLRKFISIAGSFWNDSHTAVGVDSDYAFIEANRTIDKAIRGLYAGLLPDLNSPLILKRDGTLSEVAIASLISSARRNLDQMVRDGEISTYQVDIDTAQNVASTSKVVISVKDVPVGVARSIEVDIMNVKSL